VATANATPPDLTSLDADALRSMILSQYELLQARDAQIEHLTLLIIQLHRMHFGRKSEKLDRKIEQLELQLEDLETRRAESAPLLEKLLPKAAEEQSKPARRPLPEHLPRETRTIAPKQDACPDCGGALKHLGEDVSEILEYVPATFKVIRQVRTKLSCSCCDRIVQEPAPSRPIDRGLAGPGLLAHVLVSKFADHLPLYRQSEIYERSGIELERSTLAGWADVGVDGFNLVYTVTPGTFVDFVDGVVPVLQARGLMQREYGPGTLRRRVLGEGDRLPERHPGASYRYQRTQSSAPATASAAIRSSS
jgi:transposase